MRENIVWDINSDANNIRETAIDLRGRVARNVYLKAFSSSDAANAFLASPRTVWRLRCVEKAELFLGQMISGSVVEIGAGTGWCSAVLSKREQIKYIYALDYDPVSVKELMPSVFNVLEANENKISRIIGSYNAMKLDDNSIDCVISMGALHHSENLQDSFRECARILRPGGILIASEPCYSNSLTVREQRLKENEVLKRSKVEKLYGADIGEIKAIDNSDHFYRLSEYEMAAISAGLDAYSYIFDSTSQSGGVTGKVYRFLRDKLAGDRLFLNRKIYSGYEKIVAYPYFAEKINGKVIYDPLLLCALKPQL